MDIILNLAEFHNYFCTHLAEDFSSLEQIDDRAFVLKTNHNLKMKKKLKMKFSLLFLTLETFAAETTIFSSLGLVEEQKTGAVFVVGAKRETKLSIITNYKPPSKNNT